MAVESNAYRVGADGKRYPRYYRGEAALSREDSVTSAEVGVNGGEPSDTLKAENVAGAGNESTPSRPKRHRLRPQNFIHYRQEDEVGTPGAPLPRMDDEEIDPYEDLIFWTKCHNHPYWPSVKCTEEEVEVMKVRDGINIEKETEKAGTPVTVVNFLGSNNIGIVKTSEILSYSKHFDYHSRRKNGLQFRMGLEKADELVLQARALKDPSTACTVCTKNVVHTDTENVEAGSDDGIRCARCLAHAHARCTERSGTMANPFGNEFPPVWFCSTCTKHAPVTLRARTDQEAKALKRELKRKTQKADSARKPKLSAAQSEKRNGSSDQSSVTDITRTPTKDRSGSTNGMSLGTPVKETSSASVKDNASVTNTVSHTNNTGKRKDVDSQDTHEDICFICNDGGVLLMCDYPGCPKSYHQQCLRGFEGASDDDEEDDEKEWYCPWHTCAVCGANEGHNTVAPTPSKKGRGNAAGTNSASNSSNSGNGNGSGGSQNIGRKRTSLPAPPTLVSIKAPQVMDADPKPSTPAKLERTGSDIIDGFIRCATCPTSLCMKHMRATRPVFDGSHHFVPPAISRPAKRGYFKCMHCFGGACDGSPHNISPIVQLALLLHRVWSRVVNSHDRMCKIFLEDIDETRISAKGRRALEAARKSGAVRGLFDVRNKVWRLEYHTWAAFENDVNTVSNFVLAVYGGASSLIRETCKTLPILLTQALNAFAQPITDTEERIRELGDLPEPVSEQDAFHSGCLFPSVVLSDTHSTEPRTVAKRRSFDEWEQYLENSSFLASKKLKDPGAHPAREEARGIAAALLAAAESAGGFNDHLPPSRQSLDEMLENQSMVLRSALRSTAILRDAVSKTLEGFHSDELSSDGVVTLGEMRLAAEYRMVNRNLRAKNENLLNLLNLERAAREQLEFRVKELEEQLGRKSKFSSSGPPAKRSKR